MRRRQPSAHYNLREIEVDGSDCLCQALNRGDVFSARQIDNAFSGPHEIVCCCGLPGQVERNPQATDNGRHDCGKQRRSIPIDGADHCRIRYRRRTLADFHCEPLLTWSHRIRWRLRAPCLHAFESQTQRDWRTANDSFALRTCERREPKVKLSAYRLDGLSARRARSHSDSCFQNLDCWAARFGLAIRHRRQWQPI